MQKNKTAFLYRFSHFYLIPYSLKQNFQWLSTLIRKYISVSSNLVSILIVFAVFLPIQIEETRKDLFNDKTRPDVDVLCHVMTDQPFDFPM